MTPIATWYKTKSWSWDIEPIQVLKINAKMLSIVSPYNGKPDTIMKISDSTCYWQTREEAVDYLRERLQRLRVQLASAETKFADIENSS